MMTEQQNEQPDVTEETEVEEYTLADGTRVIKTTITTRTKPPAKPKAEVITDLSLTSPFERNMLDAHNSIRALHGAPPLQLSREVGLLSVCCIILKKLDHI